jgi:phage terminase large subunit
MCLKAKWNMTGIETLTNISTFGWVIIRRTAKRECSVTGRLRTLKRQMDATHRFGADWGFASDPTVLIRCHVVGRTIYVDHEAYRVGCEIMDTPDLFFTVPDSEKWPIVADSARPETISHMRKHGFPKIMAAVKGPKSVEEGVEWLKSYDIIVHPRCQHTIDELTCYSYKTDPLTGQILPILADRDNHLIDALRYACEAIRRAVPAKTFDVQPLATVSRW